MEREAVAAVIGKGNVRLRWRLAAQQSQHRAFGRSGSAGAGGEAGTEHCRAGACLCLLVSTLGTRQKIICTHLCQAASAAHRFQFASLRLMRCGPCVPTQKRGLIQPYHPASACFFDMLLADPENFFGINIKVPMGDGSMHIEFIRSMPKEEPVKSETVSIRSKRCIIFCVTARIC
jgi:hypothetical protein